MDLTFTLKLRAAALPACSYSVQPYRIVWNHHRAWRPDLLEWVHQIQADFVIHIRIVVHIADPDQPWNLHLSRLKKKHSTNMTRHQDKINICS